MSSNFISDLPPSPPASFRSSLWLSRCLGSGRLSRRQMMAQGLVWATGGLLASCSNGSGSGLIAALAGTVPAQLPGQFRSLSGWASPTIQTLASSEELFRRLQLGWPVHHWWGGQDRGEMPALVMLGDRWLGAAVSQGLLAAWPSLGLAATGWPSLDRRWQVLVQRDRQGYPLARASQAQSSQPSLAGTSRSPGQGRSAEIWAAPYRWGTVAIAYRQDKLDEMGGPIADWQDLLRPNLTGRLVLLDRPREIIGAVLKHLGRSLNEPNPASVPQLSQVLAALHRQTLLYADQDYLQPLLLGDAWVAVGWSADIANAIERQPNLAAVVPRSGTSLWADLWVRPAPAKVGPGSRSDRAGQAPVGQAKPDPKPNSQTPVNINQTAWVDRWATLAWQPSIAHQLSSLMMGAAPSLLGSHGGDRPTATSATIGQGSGLSSLIVPSDRAIDQSEFILPLDPAAEAQYQALWENLRRSA